MRISRNVTLATAGAGAALAMIMTGCGSAINGDLLNQGFNTPSQALPSSWQKLAVGAANATLQTCAKATSLNPVGCPQQVSDIGPGNGEVTWTLLNAPLADPSIPNCPMNVSSDMHATSGQWSLDSDPLQGALVSFDTDHGNVSVTGSFDMNFTFTTPPEGPDKQSTFSNRANGHYDATLAWDGQQLKLLTIARTI